MHSSLWSYLCFRLTNYQLQHRPEVFLFCHSNFTDLMQHSYQRNIPGLCCSVKVIKHLPIVHHYQYWTYQTLELQDLFKHILKVNVI